MAIYTPPKRPANGPDNTGNEEAISRFIKGAPDGGTADAETKKRPPKPRQPAIRTSEHMTQISIQIGEEDLAALTRYCQKRRWSRSRAVRELILQALRQEERRNRREE